MNTNNDVVATLTFSQLCYFDESFNDIHNENINSKIILDKDYITNKFSIIKHAYPTFKTITKSR